MLAAWDDEIFIDFVLFAHMRFVIDFSSRFRVSPAAHNIDFKDATCVPALPEVDDSSIAEKVVAIFAPIMASLKRIEEYVDTLPDKPIGAVQS